MLDPYSLNISLAEPPSPVASQKDLSPPCPLQEGLSRPTESKTLSANCHRRRSTDTAEDFLAKIPKNGSGPRMSLAPSPSARSGVWTRRSRPASARKSLGSQILFRQTCGPVILAGSFCLIAQNGTPHDDFRNLPWLCRQMPSGGRAGRHPRANKAYMLVASGRIKLAEDADAETAKRMNARGRNVARSA
jgi:hypothetical protein